MDGMLQATRVGTFSSSYDITVDGRVLTRWDKSTWRSGGSFTLDGRAYEVRSNVWGTAFTMTDQFGTTVAAATNPSHRQWSVESGGRTYQFRRRSWWRLEYELIVDGRVVGFLKRPSSWRSTAVAELPSLPLAVQVFALVVGLTVWDTAAVAATAATS